MHAVGPFTVHRIENKPNDPLNNSYVIKDGRQIIVVGVPYLGNDETMKYAEGTARLACAGMNHIQNLIEEIAEAEKKMNDSDHTRFARLLRSYDQARSDTPSK